MVGRPPGLAVGTSADRGRGRVVTPGDVAAERNKLHGSVVEFYETEIFAGNLKIGERLPSEAEIARSFNVSTRTIRDALQILETKGLVQRRHGECAIVVRDDVSGFLGSLALTVKQLFSTDPEYFLELMDVRRIIEIDAVGRLAADGGQLKEEVERALAGMAEAARDRDFARFTACDAAFHLGIVHSTPNKILHVLYENLYGLITEVIRVTSRVPDKSPDAAYAEHAEIYQLIRARDADRAKDAIRRHIEGSSGYLKVALGSGEGMRRKPGSNSRPTAGKRVKSPL